MSLRASTTSRNYRAAVEVDSSHKPRRACLEARTRIVLNADDFGLARGIDTAILALLQRGRLSGVSAMVSAPWWGADGPRLAPFMATADIGLHFALTEVPTLPVVRRRREDQSPFTFAEVHKAAWTGRTKSMWCSTSCTCSGIGSAMWSGKRRRISIPTSMCTSRRGARAVLAFLDGLPAGERPYVRTCVERRRTILRRNVDTVRALAFGWAGARLARALRERRVATNDGFSGVHNFVAADYRALFRRFLKDARADHRHLSSRGGRSAGRSDRRRAHTRIRLSLG